MCVSAKLLQLSMTLCDPEVYGLPGSSVHGILQARILKWNPWPPPGDLSQTGIQSTFSPPTNTDLKSLDQFGKSQLSLLLG